MLGYIISSRVTYNENIVQFTCRNIPRLCFVQPFMQNEQPQRLATRLLCAVCAHRVLSAPRFPFGDNNQDRWGTRSSHVSPRTEDGASTVTVHARPLSRERSKSKPTSQPIVNTGTTGEFNSIRTRSSDCSIVRHRIPPTRSCGLFSLYLSLPPFPTLACNPQRSPLTLSRSLTLCNVSAGTHVRREKRTQNTFSSFPRSTLPLSIYLSDFILRVLQKPKYIRGARKVPS